MVVTFIVIGIALTGYLFRFWNYNNKYFYYKSSNPRSALSWTTVITSEAVGYNGAINYTTFFLKNNQTPKTVGIFCGFFFFLFFCDPMLTVILGIGNMTEHWRLHSGGIKSALMYSPFGAFFSATIQAENYLGVLLLFCWRQIIEMLPAAQMHWHLHQRKAISLNVR